MAKHPARVQIQIVSDAIYEGNETIEISIEDVSSDRRLNHE